MAFVGVILFLILAVLAAIFIVLLICEGISLTGVLIIVLSSFSRARKRESRIRGIPGIVIGSLLVIVPFLFLQKSFMLASETALCAMNYRSSTDVLETCVEDGSLDEIYDCFNESVDVDEDDVEEFRDSISELDLSHSYVTGRQMVTFRDNDIDNIEAYVYTIARVSRDPEDNDLMTIEVCVVNHSDYRGLWYIYVYEPDGTLYDSIGEEIPLRSISTCDITRDEVD